MQQRKMKKKNSTKFAKLDLCKSKIDKNYNLLIKSIYYNILVGVNPKMKCRSELNYNLI